MIQILEKEQEEDMCYNFTFLNKLTKWLHAKFKHNKTEKYKVENNSNQPAQSRKKLHIESQDKILKTCLGLS